MKKEIDLNYRPFMFEYDKYTRDGDPVEMWVKAQTDYISKLYGYDKEYVENWVRQEMKPGGCVPFFDRKVQFIHQETLGNRELKVSSFHEYQNLSRTSDYVLSPSQTAYKNPSKYPVLNSKFTDRNAKLRSMFKKRGQDAKITGDMKQYASDNELQKKKKEVNNSYSGANSSPFNPLYNASGHQSLTSTCRSATSYANMIAERFLTGNRMYVNLTITLQELSNACLLANHDHVMEAVNVYGLKIPTFDDVFECAKKSFIKYFQKKSSVEEIKRFIKTMDDASRCAFVYIGDLYHLDLLNPEFTGKYFDKVIALAQYDDTPCEEYYPKVSSDIQALVFGMMKKVTQGHLYFDKTNKKTLPDDRKHMINNAIYAFALLQEEYQLLIEALWRPTYLPSGMAYLRTMLREAILTSDTDSAIMTTQYWNKRIFGEYNFSEEAYTVAFNLIYYVSESVANAFGKLCGNMGVPPDLIDQLGAKNEYAFTVYCISEAMKHYYAEKAIEEGRVFDEPELEMKGVGYISSRHDSIVEENLQEYVMKDIIGNVKDKIYLTVDDVMSRPIKIEKQIRDTIRSGGIIYQTDSIKDADSYKTGENNATYRHYTLWKDVFAPTYGNVDAPPYSTYKVPVKLEKKRDIQAWITRIEDRALAARMKAFIEEHEINQMSSILVPIQVAEVSGIPKEIVQAVDEKRATSQIMGPFYLALGGLGYIDTNNLNTKLMTDPHYFNKSLTS